MLDAMPIVLIRCYQINASEINDFWRVDLLLAVPKRMYHTWRIYLFIPFTLVFLVSRTVLRPVIGVNIFWLNERMNDGWLTEREHVYMYTYTCMYLHIYVHTDIYTDATYIWVIYFLWKIMSLIQLITNN